MLERCERCKELLFSDRPCNCRPFKVYYPEYYGYDPQTVYGFSYIGVAEKVAEKLNCGDPVFDEDIFEYPVEITDESGEMKKIQCSAYVDIVYLVTEIQDK